MVLNVITNRKKGYRQEEKFWSGLRRYRRLSCIAFVSLSTRKLAVCGCPSRPLQGTLPRRLCHTTEGAIMRSKNGQAENCKALTLGTSPRLQPASHSLKTGARLTRQPGQLRRVGNQPSEKWQGRSWGEASNWCFQAQ